MLNSRMILPLVLASVVGALPAGTIEGLVSPLPGLAMAAQSIPPIVQAARFEVVDASGAVRGVLRMAPEGTGRKWPCWMRPAACHDDSEQ